MDSDLDKVDSNARMLIPSMIRRLAQNKGLGEGWGRDVADEDPGSSISQSRKHASLVDQAVSATPYIGGDMGEEGLTLPGVR